MPHPRLPARFPLRDAGDYRVFLKLGRLVQRLPGAIERFDEEVIDEELPFAAQSDRLRCGGLQAPEDPLQGEGRLAVLGVGREEAVG